MPDDDFEAKMDLETLERAEEIRSNSSKMARVRQQAEKERQRLTKFAKGPSPNKVPSGARGSAMARKAGKKS